MSIFSNIWGTLKFSTQRGLVDALNGTSIRYHRNKEGQLVYRKRRTYKSHLVQEASRIAIQAAMNEINQLYPRYLKKIQKEKRKEVFGAQMRNLSTLIENQQIFGKTGYGKLVDSETNREILAIDKFGTVIPEALMLYYKGDELINAGQYYSLAETDGGNGSEELTTIKAGDFKTKLVVHIDLAPEVSLSSKKNVILTPVQGRDFSRKELVSGGDLEFDVKGSIICHQPGVYPTAAVQKFLLTMQYGGILNVHHFQFDQLGVKRVIVRDWQLDSQEFKNVQPYSFSCVAVEPDEEIQIKDTIKELDGIIVDAPLDKRGWEQLLLKEKYRQIAQNALSSLINASISELTDRYTNNI